MENELEMVTFTLDGRQFALPTSAVLQLIRAVTIQPTFPERKQLEGLINYQGALIPVLDFRAALKLPARALAVSDFLIVLFVDKIKFVVRVDGIEKVFSIPQSKIQKIPMDPPATGLIPVHNQSIHLLDPFQLAHRTQLPQNEVAHAS